MYAERHVVTIVTDAAGAGTGYTPVVSGRVLTVVYVKAGSSPYAAGVDFTITAEATGENLWTETNVNASAVRAPRQPTHDAAGAASLYAAAGEPVEAPIVLAKDRVKIVIAQGGDTLTGTFHVIVG